MTDEAIPGVKFAMTTTPRSRIDAGGIKAEPIWSRAERAGIVHWDHVLARGPRRRPMAFAALMRRISTSGPGAGPGRPVTELVRQGAGRAAALRHHLFR